MDLSLINNLSKVSDFSSSKVHNIIDNKVDYLNKSNRNESFENIFQSAMSMVNETNALSNAAEEEEMKYALGYSDSTHDLQVAQEKANISLQYTVAIRNKVLDAYKEIMNLQF